MRSGRPEEGESQEGKGEMHQKHYRRHSGRHLRGMRRPQHGVPRPRAGSEHYRADEQFAGRTERRRDARVHQSDRVVVQLHVVTVQVRDASSLTLGQDALPSRIDRPRPYGRRAARNWTVGAAPGQQLIASFLPSGVAKCSSIKTTSKFVGVDTAASKCLGVTDETQPRKRPGCSSWRPPRESSGRGATLRNCRGTSSRPVSVS